VLNNWLASNVRSGNWKITSTVNTIRIYEYLNNLLTNKWAILIIIKRITCFTGKLKHYQSATRRRLNMSWKMTSTHGNVERIRVRIHQKYSFVTPIVFVGISHGTSMENVNLSQFIEFTNWSHPTRTKSSDSPHTKQQTRRQIRNLYDFFDFWWYCCHLAQFIDGNLRNKDSSYRDFLKI
jgi:hypothetical protein